MKFCEHESICGGCSETLVPHLEQISIKKTDFQEKLKPFSLKSDLKILTVGEKAERVRVDLTLENGKLGFYKKNKTQVFQLRSCSHFTFELQNWFQEFSKIKFPFVEKGSIRLRVSPSGGRGVWLDFSNQNIKDLLQEKFTLLKLLDLSTVEIGQKRKLLVLKDGILKLSEPCTKTWFQTYIKDTPYSLECVIGGFTQPSLSSNRLIVKAIEELISSLDLKTVMEWGSGIGNLTLPLASYSKELLALEVHDISVLSLKKNLVQSGLENRVQIFQGDFQHLKHQNKLKEATKINLKDLDLLAVNPPRSGLKEFTNLLGLDFINPRYFMYLSCNPKTLVEDGLKLQKAGYQLEKAHLIDQFPQTVHYESLTFWVKI